jgi:hypothetical protein
MIWALVRELALALLAIAVCIVAGTIGIGVLGDGAYALLAVIVVLPLGALGLVLACLYVLRRPAVRPLRWSLLAGLIGGLGVYLALALTGSIRTSWVALWYLSLLVLPAPLLQGLVSGAIARRWPKR